MITILSMVIFTLVLVMTGITILNVCCVPDCSESPPPLPDSSPLVSVLIPARNEESNLGTLLETLTRQTYPNLEVIVLDDNSTDATFTIGQSYAEAFHVVTIVRGKKLEAGWFGKPFACAQLRTRANGEYLLFIDADVQLAPHAIARLMHLARRPPKVGLLTCFPNQTCYSWGERLIVPLIDLILYSSAPLPLFERSLHPRFAAANGQCMLFRADAYDVIGGHEVVKREILEDIELARASKRAGYRVRVVAGRGGVQCRMYRTIGEIFQGFGKNCFVAVGRRGWQALVVGVFFTFVFLVPLFSIGHMNWALLTVALILFIRMSIAIRFGYSVLDAVIGHVASIILALCIVGYSWGWFRFGRPEWRGRLVK